MSGCWGLYEFQNLQCTRLRKHNFIDLKRNIPWKYGIYLLACQTKFLILLYAKINYFEWLILQTSNLRATSCMGSNPVRGRLLFP